MWIRFLFAVRRCVLTCHNIYFKFIFFLHFVANVSECCYTFISTNTHGGAAAAVGWCTEHNTPIPNREPYSISIPRAHLDHFIIIHTHTRRHHHACFVCIYLIFHAHAPLISIWNVHLTSIDVSSNKIRTGAQSTLLLLLLCSSVGCCWIRTHKSCSLLYRYRSLYKYIVRNSILVLSYFPRNAFQLCANKILYEIKTFFIIANCD